MHIFHCEYMTFSFSDKHVHTHTHIVTGSHRLRWLSDCCLLFRVAVWCCRSSHPVRRGLDVCGPGQLETPQHSAALQGQSSLTRFLFRENITCFTSKTVKRGLWSNNANCIFCVHQVPDGATVALVPRHTKHIHHDNHDYVAGESELIWEQYYCNNKSNCHLKIIFASTKPLTEC